ncbi:hypothetical protein MTY59_15910 [Mycobacterium senriense]|uniref:Antitoxin n=1 Tax=Mycobacterium senriense TaxID=2775496 RepID=A0ABN6IDF9_9MYCO|nr:hypothetical protein MTY59_15910 [Mycobacterium senriense]
MQTNLKRTKGGQGNMQSMAPDTSAIQVPAPIHDKLAAQARQRGISIAALLEDLAEQAERQAAFAS